MSQKSQAGARFLARVRQLKGDGPRSYPTMDYHVRYRGQWFPGCREPELDPMKYLKSNCEFALAGSLNESEIASLRELRDKLAIPIPHETTPDRIPETIVPDGDSTSAQREPV